MGKIYSVAKMNFHMVSQFIGKTLLLYTVLFGGLFFFNNSQQVLIIGTLLGCVIMVVLFSQDEADNLQYLYGVLPVSKRQLVRGRYCFVVAAYLALLAYSAALQLLLDYCIGQMPELYGSIFPIMVTYLTGAFMIGTAFPIFVRWGYQKGKFLMMIPMVAFMATMFIKPLLRVYIWLLMQALAIATENLALFLVGGLAIGGLLLLVSEQVSERLARNER